MGYQNKRKRSISPSDRNRHSHRGVPIAVRALRLRRGIAELGEPSKYSIEESLPQLAAELAEGGEILISNAVFPMIKAVVHEQPHKVSLIAALLECADVSSPGLLQAALHLAHEEISGAVKSGDYELITQWVRFVGALHSVDHSAFRTLLLDLAKRAIVFSREPRGAELFTAAVHGSIYLCRTTGEQPSEELVAEFVKFDSGDLSKSELCAPVYGPNAPYESKPIIKLLEEAVKTAVESKEWDVSFLLDVTKFVPLKDASTSLVPPAKETAPTTEDPAVSVPGMEDENDETKIEDGETEEARPESENQETKPVPRFLAVHIPQAEEMPSWKLPLEIEASFADGYRNMRTLVYINNDIPTTPPANTLFGSLVRQLASEVISKMEFNRKEVMRQLISFDLFFDPKNFAPPGFPFDALSTIPAGEPTWKVEDLALEAVLEQMLRLPVSEFPIVYYGSVLIEACIVAPQAIAPVLGRSVRFFFKNCESLDAEVFWRVIEWFSHHASNFNFTWKWVEWLEYLSLPKFHPKMVFMRELIAKQVRLSYPDRLRNSKVMPEEFQELIPKVPEAPGFTYSDDKLVMALVDAMGEPDGDITSQVIQIQEQCVSEAIGKPANVMDANLADKLIKAILETGNTSPTHAATAINRHINTIKDKISHEKYYVEATFDYWSESPWNAPLILKQFVSVRVLTPKTILEYVFATRDLLLSSLGWEIITKYWEYAEPLLVNLDINQNGTADEWDEWWNLRLHRALKRFITINSGIAELKAEANVAKAASNGASPDLFEAAEAVSMEEDAPTQLTDSRTDQVLPGSSENLESAVQVEESTIAGVSENANASPIANVSM